MSLDQVRAIADAVLYEGYLLYPYRASSSKNQSRWQFGVLGPPQAAPSSFAESPEMSMQCLLAPGSCQEPDVTLRVRFLQVQDRDLEQRLDSTQSEPTSGIWSPVGELVVDGRSLLSWQEATECELPLPAYALAEIFEGARGPLVETVLEVSGACEVEPVLDDGGTPVGRIVRRRSPLVARVQVRAEPVDGLARLSVTIMNDHPDLATTKDDALRLSLISAHVVLIAEGAEFVSLLEPPATAAAAAASCTQQRCYPVLVGPVGSHDTVLGSPIILYDHPEIAEQSAGALFDSTEIDEILTLRVMTMTDAEKTEARATDPRAAEIIDRCDAMSPEVLRNLHGVLRDPRATSPGRSDPIPAAPGPATFETGDVPWWDPAADESVQPDTDSVVIDGVTVARGSLVRVHPSRRADAQDLFFVDQVARVMAVLSDVDGATHVALVLVDDPAAALHEEAGRFFYFAPDELEPLDQAREESHP